MGPYIDSEAPFPSYRRVSALGICIYPPCRLKRELQCAEGFKRSETTPRLRALKCVPQHREAEFRIFDSPSLSNLITQLSIHDISLSKDSHTMRCIRSAVELDIHTHFTLSGQWSDIDEC